MLDMLALALAGLGLALARALRWQFLLRRAALRLPIRPVVTAAIASNLAAGLTPFGAGLFLRPWLVPVSRGLHLPLLLVTLADLGFDAGAILVLQGRAREAVFGVLAMLGAVAVIFLARIRPGGGRRPPALSMGAMSVVWAAVPSIAAWAVLLFLVARSAGTVPMPDLVAGLVPLAAAWAQGGTPERLLLAAAVILPGLWALGLILRRLLGAGRRAAADQHEAARHFDDIAEDYLKQWSPELWKTLLERRLAHLTAAVGSPGTAGAGLDLGCGLGLQTLAMRERAYAVIGLDPARNLLGYGRSRGAPVVTGSAFALPARAGSLGFVYSIGVLHHLPDPDAQRVAIAEVRRVLRPGGRLVVQETNPVNPLFRFYMGYLFPLLKVIDEGTEWWIHPGSWSASGLRVERIAYFTFVPDFFPPWLLRWTRPLEAWLERSPLRTYSAHYMVVLTRNGAGAS
jgi:SAM-dependent methyltransferase